MTAVVGKLKANFLSEKKSRSNKTQWCAVYDLDEFCIQGRGVDIVSGLSSVGDTVHDLASTDFVSSYIYV